VEVGDGVRREIGHLHGVTGGRKSYDPAMTAPSDHLRLAADFPQVTREDWRELVTAVLRRSGVPADTDPELALSSPTYDGLLLKPLYTAADAPPAVGVPGRAPFVRGTTATTAGWDVRQRHLDPDAGRTNAAALADLTNGATSLWLTIGEGALAVADLPRALDGVYLDLAPVALDAGAATREAAAAFLALVARSGIAAEEVRGTLGADPIGLRARTGASADLGLLDIDTLPNLRVATVDGTVYNDAGGSDSDELAMAAAVGVAYLRALTDGGRSVEDALGRLEFRYSVNADQFASIAKLRAARVIWNRIGALAGAAPEARGQVQHAVTSAAMMTRRDPWVNMLRTTIACFAAAIGGAQAITVAPFDSAIGVPDDFARRIARNTSAILHDESSLARVVDAAGGSWYVETLTAELAQVAWDKFTAIERAGGALAALDRGDVATMLSTTRSRRAANIATRSDPITGVSEFALITETPIQRPPSAVRTGGLLPVTRYAEDFERLRDRSDAHLAATGIRPRVFLATLGPIAAHTGRLGFAANLFQAAGIEPIEGPVPEFAASGTGVACLCSSDKIYAAEAAQAAGELKAEYLWLAGPVADYPVDGYLYAGCDALAVLTTTLQMLGVA
jgi:methylmalonyl-CoA mutase